MDPSLEAECIQADAAKRRGFIQALGRNPTLVDTQIGANERGWFQWI